MNNLLGEYEVTLDAKGRFLLPANFKKQLPAEGGGMFVVNRGMESCLNLYPIKSWESKVTDISALSDFNPEVRKFQRYFLNGASQLELDSAGRLLLPKGLIEYAGLEKEVILIATFSKIEIWDKSKYNQFFESFSQEEYSKLGDKLMGKRNED